jgi:hypothetical protein
VLIFALQSHIHFLVFNQRLRFIWFETAFHNGFLIFLTRRKKAKTNQDNVAYLPHENTFETKNAQTIESLPLLD